MTWMNLKEQYGDVYVFWLGFLPVLMLNTPEMIKQALGGNSLENFHKLQMPKWANRFAQPLFAKSLLFEEGNEWKSTRKALTPAFMYSNLKGVSECFTQLGTKLLTKLEEERKQSNNGVEVYRWTSAFALDVIGQAGFSYDFGAMDQTETQAKSDLNTLMQNFTDMKRMFIPLFERLPLDVNKQSKLAADRTLELMRSVIENKRKNQTPEENQQHNDVLSVMLEYERSNPAEQLSDERLVQNMFLFFLAGHETSAVTLAFVLHNLSKHKDVQEKVFEEVNRVLDGRIPTFADLDKLQYLESVIKETLRLQPPATLMTRVTSTDQVIGDYHVPAGVTIGIPIFTLHRDERWWSDPETFNPDRFNDKDQNSKRHTYAWIPFSAGPRICIGLKFAMMEMKTGIAMIVQQYQLSLPDDFELEYIRYITLKPNGIRINLTPRQQQTPTTEQPTPSES